MDRGMAGRCAELICNANKPDRVRATQDIQTEGAEMSKFVEGPFYVNGYSDAYYVTSERGVRMAETEGEDALAKAEQICDALNAAHYIALASGVRK
jgi:hypothetical protein